jgi:hypothetical protein
MAHSKSIEIVKQKCQQKMMKVDFQTWVTFKILWGNGIFAPLRIMNTPLKVLKLNFRLGNADFDRGTLQKYWNRKTKISRKNDESRFSNMNNLVKSYWVLEYLSLYVLWTLPWRLSSGIFVWVNRILTVEHSKSIEIVKQKCQQKMMKVDFQTRVTFKMLWGNGIFAPLRIMNTPLKVLK